MPVRCLLALAVLLAVPTSAGAEMLDARTHTAAGVLSLAGATDAARTVLSIRGRLRVRDTSLLEVLRCVDARCLRRTHTGRITRTLRSGRRRLDLRLSFPMVPGLWIGVRHRGHLLAARRVLTPARLAAPSSPPPAAPGAAAGPPSPVTLSVSATPPLAPAYSAQVPDYTVLCSDTQPVSVTAEVPYGQTVTVDGVAMPAGQVSRRDAGLHAGQAFSFTVTDGGGTHVHTVRCLPGDFPKWRVERTGSPDAQWLVLGPSSGFPGSRYVAIADDGGVPVWWMRAPLGKPVDATVLPDATIAWNRSAGTPYSQSVFDRYRLDGTPAGALTTVGVGADHHELQQAANGDYLMIAYEARQHVDLTSAGGPADATVLDADIQEVKPDGTRDWSWHSQDHIGLDETGPWGLANDESSYNGQLAYDIVHANSVADDGDGIVISARHLDAVYRIRKSDGSIDWKLGGTARPESLAFVDDPLGAQSFGGQHDARVTPDGTLTVHDNGSGRGRPPRAVRYRIDPTDRTATLVEQLTDPRAPVSTCCGSARRLSTGHWVMDWGSGNLVTELDAAGSPVLTLTFPGTTFSYRAQPLEAGLLSRATLHAGMDAMFPRP